jgi:hypothetical protein
MEEAWFNGIQWRFPSRENWEQHSLNSKIRISIKPAPVNKNSLSCANTIGTNGYGENSGME